MRLAVLFVTIFFSFHSFGFTINGNIKNTSGYRYRVSIFHLRSVEDFYWLTGTNLIETTYTDSLGAFTLKANYLPEEETFYRINIKQIKLEGDERGDLIQHNAGKIVQSNSIFLVLKNSSVINVQLSNDSNVIKQHLFYPTLPISKLYNIARDYDRKVDSIDKVINSSGSSHTGANEELAALRNDKILDLKKKIAEQLMVATKQERNANAAVLSYMWMEILNGFDLENATNAYNLIKEFDKNNKYLSAIGKRLENARRDEQLFFYRNFAIAASILAAISIIAFAVVLYNYKKSRNQLTELAALSTSKDIPSLLTRKELEIFEMLSQGLSNKEIASAQFLEVSTIKKHISNIYTKTGIKSRKEASQYLKKGE
jgi:DNA-binding CsgD family transcriptional regulator